MVKCPVCGMEFKTQEEHDKHHQEAHGGEPAGEIKCPMCGATFNSKEELDKHAKDAHSGSM